MTKKWTSLLVSLAVFGAMLVVNAAANTASTPAPFKVTQPSAAKKPDKVTAKPFSATQLNQLRNLQAAGNTHAGSNLSNTKVMSVAQIANSDIETSSVVEQISPDNTDINSNNPMAQVTSVSQLSDVQPTDWAFQALQSLVERYSCIAGYPNRTFHGNRALSRYEFAAGLNACLNRVNELISSGTSKLVRKEDLVTLQRLQAEEAPQLTIRGRVDTVEATTAQLEANQFSTTTKLNAEAIFAVVSPLAGQNANGQNISRNPILGDRVRFNFDTSFTGQDLLRTRLQALNIDAFSGNTTLTPEGDLRFAGGTFATGNNNSIGLDALLYSFPIGNSTTIVIEGNVGQPDDYTDTVNPYIDNDGTSGALSNFGTRNPIYDLINGAGLGLRQELGEKLELSLGYIGISPSVASPTESNGLFKGPHGAIAQLTIKPTKQFKLGLTYLNSYDSDLTAGSRRANLRSSLASISAPVTPAPVGSNAGASQPAAGLAAFGGINLPVSSNSYGFEASYQLSPKFVINGWVGYTATRTLSTLGGTINRGDLSILNYAVNLVFPDLGKEGSLGGIIFGMEPRVISVSPALRSQIGTDRNNSLHIEGFYQYQLNANIAITSGVIAITNPDFNNRNADHIIGAIRTTFTF